MQQHLQIDTTKTVRLLYHFLEKVQPKLAAYVGPQDHFLRDWGISPQDCQAYVQLLEQHFNIHILDQDRNQMQSIQHTLDYLVRQALQNTN